MLYLRKFKGFDRACIWDWDIALASEVIEILQEKYDRKGERLFGKKFL